MPANDVADCYDVVAAAAAAVVVVAVVVVVVEAVSVVVYNWLDRMNHYWHQHRCYLERMKFLLLKYQM